MSIPIDLVFHNVEKDTALLRLLLSKSFYALPQNVKDNLYKHAEAKHPAKVVFYYTDIPNKVVRKLLKRSPMCIIEKTDFKNDVGVFFHADNAIFINTFKTTNILFTLNHEFGHLVDHHNLNRHKKKWRSLVKDVSKGCRITQYSEKSYAEYFAEAYAMYTTNLEIFNFIVQNIFKEE